MKTTTAQKMLKIVGILTIIGAIILLIFGGLALSGTQSGELVSNPEDKSKAGLLVFGGVALLIAGVANLVEGIFSILTSKNGKYAKTTFILTIISSIYSLVQSIANYSKEGFNTANVLTLVIEIVLSVLVCVAANTIKVAYEEGRLS